GVLCSCCWQESKVRRERKTAARFMRRILRLPASAGQWYTDSQAKEGAMDDIERDNDSEYEDDEEQIEQMIIENGILLHSLAALLVRKGILKQEEIDAEMDRLYDEMENFDGQ